LGATLLFTAGCSYTDSHPDDFDAGHIYKKWYVAQKAFNGAITVYDPDTACERPYLIFEEDYTFEKVLTSNCQHYTTAGTWHLDTDQRNLILTYNDSVRHCDVHVLNSGTLALQSTFDINGDGIVESVRETYLAD
jgi:hypothetical protein